ncbi:MAG TPA: SPOR domain-containing protein [Novosphingobium sp.]|nr:SPOR domain-containing protein [Novosphingobium sp.]
MKNFMRFFRYFPVAGVIAALPVASALADVKTGVEAWSAGNYEAAVKEWKPLADAGDPDALFNLAQAYKMGRGVPADPRKAEELYGKAAAKGHVQASDVYGLLLFQNGDHAKAMPYIQASAARGDPRAQYLLGLAMFNGDNVAKDWVRAYALVSLAQQAGLSQAARALPQMDQYISLEDRQKSVILAQKIAAESKATRARQLAAAELGNGTIAPETTSTDTPVTAGADYTRKTPPSAAANPKPAPTITPAPVSVPAPAANAKPAARTATASGPWRVQLGAFGVAANADALWAKVQARPELAGHGKVVVPAGKLTKLQASGFASKDKAAAACARLAAGGFACMPVRD